MTFLSANHYWRIAATGLCYIVFAIGAFLPGAYVMLLAIRPLSNQEKQVRARKAIQQLCRFYVDFMQFLGLMNYRLSGLPTTEPRGHLVISNHTMLIDALFVLGYVPNLCCVVKSALVTNPFTRIPVKLAGYLANDDHLLVQQAADKLAAGENVLIFPEGTRNQYDTQLEFKRGAANIAVFAQCPILPAVIICQPRALQKGQPWYQLPTRKSIITVSFGDAIQLADVIDTALARPIQYRRLTSWLREHYLARVSQIITPNAAI